MLKASGSGSWTTYLLSLEKIDSFILVVNLLPVERY